eukprot:symbB.v1.2.018528.t1/scaffold1481.1/size116218/7
MPVTQMSEAVSVSTQERLSWMEDGRLQETVWKKEDSTFSQRDAFAMTPAARGPVVGGCRPRYPSHDWEILRVTGPKVIANPGAKLTLEVSLDCDHDLDG